MVILQITSKIPFSPSQHCVLPVKHTIPSKWDSHRGWGRHLQVHGLKDETHLWRHLNNLPTHQTQLLVVVQHRVHILDPHGVDWTVKNQPFPVRALADKKLDGLHLKYMNRWRVSINQRVIGTLF